MKYKNLGSSGVKVSSLCLGAMTFGEADEKSFMHKVGSDEATAHAVLDRALAAGINFVDTADVYGQDGLSERVFGNWLVDRKARPGELNWGSPGVGTGGHLVTELLLKQTGIKGQHVPYPGTTQQLMAAAAGTLQFTFDTPGNSKGIRDAGKVIALAVTGDKRSVSAPEVPTFKELGYEGYDDLRVANGLLAPTGTPPEIVRALNREMVKLNSSGPIHDRLVQASYDPGTMTPEQYGAMIDRELKQWGDIVRDTGVQIKN